MVGSMPVSVSLTVLDKVSEREVIVVEIWHLSDVFFVCFHDTQITDCGQSVFPMNADTDEMDEVTHNLYNHLCSLLSQRDFYVRVSIHVVILYGSFCLKSTNGHHLRNYRNNIRPAGCHYMKSLCAKFEPPSLNSFWTLPAFKKTIWKPLTSNHEKPFLDRNIFTKIEQKVWNFDTQTLVKKFLNSVDGFI